MSTAAKGNEERGSISLRHDRGEIDLAQSRILATLDAFAYPEASKFAVRLALEEGLANAFNHGHRTLPPDVPVRVEYVSRADSIELAIEDQGPGFDPNRVPDPTLDENLETPTGRGLLLMRAYMASVTYNSRGNRVTMVYHRPAQG